MATVRPEGTGDKIVTLEELALAYDTLNGTKIAKDISQLDSIVGDPASTDYFMLGRNGVEYKVDYDALATAIINKLGLPLSVANGGSGLSASPSLLTNLASSSAANVMQASPRPGVTGTLAAANGGTGNTSLNASANAFINALSVGADVPADNDYYVTQYVNGGTSNTNYYRRKVSTIWSYIGSKASTLTNVTVGNSTYISSVSGGYVRVGRLVVFSVSFTMKAAITSSANNAISGLPVPLMQGRFLAFDSDSTTTLDDHRFVNVSPSGTLNIKGPYAKDSTYSVCGSYVSAS